MKFRHLYDKYIQTLSPIPTTILPMLDFFHCSIKAVLFDVYGTLFISDSGDIGVSQKYRLKNNLIKHLLSKYEILFPPENIVQRLTGEINQTHAKLKEKHIDFPEVEIDEIWMKVLSWDDKEKAMEFAIEFELIVNPVFPMPNLEKMLNQLNQKQVVLGIISNAQFFTLDIFDYFLDKSPFQLGFIADLVYLSYQLGHAKPSPYLFELAKENLKKKHISADNVLYVGNDMLNDIFTAQSVGFKTALFAGDSRSLRLRKDHEACKDIHPDVIITDLHQLVDLI